jgi:outer membrane protein assembly factor BamB/orotate phosphoribosyltransferase
MKYDDLREAISAHALVHAAPSTRIIAADGISPAKWLFDFRALLLQPQWLKRYAEVFWDEFGDRYPFQVCGMESAAISLVAAISLEGAARGKPVNGLFVRKSRKRTGLMKRVEGAPTKEPVILIDDLINSGNAFKTQLDILEREGLTVVGMFALIAFRDRTAYEQLVSATRLLRTPFTLEDFGIPLERDTAPVRPQLEEVWRFAAPDPSFNYVLQKSTPVIDDEKIYFGSDNGMFYALDQKSGAVVWSFKTGPHPAGKGIFSSPALHEGSVYFGAYDGNVYALDTKTGALKWKYDDADWVGSSPAMAPDLGLVFIGLEFGLLGKRGGIVALRTGNGERVWQHRAPEHTHGSPLYIKEKNIVVVGSNDESVCAYAADSGTVLWRVSVRGNVMSSFSYDAERDLIVFGSLGGACYGFHCNGTSVFAIELGAGVYSTPLIHTNTAYVASLDKHLYAIDLSNGTVRWKYGTNGRVFATPTMIDGLVYLGSNDGCLHEIDPNTGKGSAVFQTPERIVNKIAYNPRTQRFFVPTVANELYCLRRPE